MNGLNTGQDHIRQILAARTPQENPATDEEATQIEAALRQYMQQQGWQRTIDDLIVKLGRRLREGPSEPTPQAGPVIVYTDGACIGNPGPGGWCAIIHDNQGEETILQGGHWDTTNNRMEMQAVISALQIAPKEADVSVFSDSQYVCKAFNDGWLKRWQRNGWRTRTGNVLNQDVWALMADLTEGNGKRTVSFNWVRGHAGHPLNERADQIARRNAQDPRSKSSPGPTGRGSARRARR